VFKDMTIHDFDEARFFLGEIVSVNAIGQKLDPALADVDDDEIRSILELALTQREDA